MADLAPLSIVFNAAQLANGVLRGPKRITLDSIEVDCTLSESYDYAADVTEFEVEEGSNVSDHRRTSPAEFSISGLISDTPLPSYLIDQSVGAAALKFGLTGPALTDNAVFTRDAFAKLEQLYERDTTSQVVTKYRTFDNMVVKSLRISRESGTGMVLPFTATFKQIRFVRTAVGTLQGDPSLQNASALGSQGGEEADPKLKDDGKTWARRGADAIAGPGNVSKWEKQTDEEIARLKGVLGKK